MRKYQESGKLETVICNGCGKKLVVERGILREGGFSVNYPWDYFSEKDGVNPIFYLFPLKIIQIVHIAIGLTQELTMYVTQN